MVLLLGLALTCGLVGKLIAHLADQSLRGGSTYEALVREYREGDPGEAVRRFRAWSAGDVERVWTTERRTEQAAAEDKTLAFARLEDEWLAAAVMLNTEALHQGGPYDLHLALARNGFRKLAGRVEARAFVRDWQVVMASWLLASGHSEEARRLAAAAEPDAEGLLLQASIADGIASRPPPGQDAVGVRRWNRGALLREAEQAYRRALAHDPTLVEAKVRLGWMLVRDGREDEARVLLTTAHQESTEGYLSYLSALFLGRLLERRGDASLARTWYQRALDEYPEGQTACVALGHLVESGGASRDGWSTVLGMFARPTGPHRDPWWVYLDAQFWQMDRRMTAMRRYARARR